MPYFDIGWLSVSFYTIYTLRRLLDASLQHLSFYLPFLCITLALFIASGILFSLYEKDRPLFSLSYLSDFLRTFSLWSFTLLILPFFTKVDYSRVIVISYILLSFILLYLARFLLAWATHTGEGSDQEVMSASRDILSMIQVTHDPLTFLENIRMTRTSNVVYRLLKRIFDIGSSGLALLILSPLFPYLAWKIKRDSPGPAFFIQERVGKNGKTFLLYKFRTMYTDTPKYANSPRVDVDPRITSVGRVLRHYSLDELPQLLNILKGDMSVVGPRPEMPFIVEKYAPWQKARLRTEQGLTGLWQVLGRKDLPLDENLEYDIYYVFNQSFFLDCAIILKTVPHLILPKGAY
jgi:lipopolysaccharide/colanic/teichoic acid biosynthesis glycosyltransferase